MYFRSNLEKIYPKNVSEIQDTLDACLFFNNGNALYAPLDYFEKIISAYLYAQISASDFNNLEEELSPLVQSHLKNINLALHVILNVMNDKRQPYELLNDILQEKIVFENEELLKVVTYILEELIDLIEIIYLPEIGKTEASLLAIKNMDDSLTDLSKCSSRDIDYILDQLNSFIDF